MLAPCGRDKALCLAVLATLLITRVVVPPLPVILADDVSQRCGLASLVLNTEGPTLKIC